jgi:two-component system, LuxR family, response regulator FixJ
VSGSRTADAKVCIVDDDRSILDALRGLLASEKIEAATFDDPAQFLNYVQSHNIRVAILDVAMPGLSGIQLQKQLCRFSPGTKVIMMTGRPDAEIRDLALNGGAFAFLAKPLDDEVLLSSVRHALGE